MLCRVGFNRFEVVWVKGGEYGGLFNFIRNSEEEDFFFMGVGLFGLFCFPSSVCEWVKSIFMLGLWWRKLGCLVRW